MLEDKKIALIHYWLLSMRGGEKVVESICDVFPGLDIYTLVYDKENISENINKHKITTSFIQKLPFGKTKYKSYLPLMPVAIEQFNLMDYDLVISSESGIAKGVITRPETCHICYCHSPMRYLWNMYFDYLKNENIGWFKRKFIMYYFNYLRLWDYSTAARVDYFICNSDNVRKRILKYYRRDAKIINPPVDVNNFTFSDRKQDYYLVVSQLVSYKRVDIAVKAFNKSEKELVIIGKGPEYKKLKKMAGPNVKFLGWQPFEKLKEYYANAKALIFPGEEDFGITPVEAQASGTPVIGFRRGGLLETVEENVTGVFFDEQEPDSLASAVEHFEENVKKFDFYKIREKSMKFSKDRFEKEIREYVEEKYQEYQEEFNS